MKPKNNLPKDSLARIVNIMEYIEVNHGYVTIKDIKDKFEEIGWNLFKRYCLEINQELYATSHSGIGEESIYVLTPLGVRKLHELRGVLAQEERDRQFRSLNRVIAFTAAALALFGAVNVLTMLGAQTFQTGANKIGLAAIAFTVTIVTAVFIIYNTFMFFKESV